ncbi:MAG: NAD(P)-dependent oxidoreductase [Rhodospirillaceae bacterium]|jgi:3-hydroxyisobutyrate dehydrogenase-like beta-hydroxyacid dehydrogenase|nr:NAD(P)-dependent oxidoreductase [Rhodospirillaceae bacterium]MBT6136626.1 NAD(P)-dependent oxidoreductase [Rhodospirillaceae bacterium]
MSIGFVGLGGMGGGVVKNLALKGRAVRCYDLDDAKMQRAAGFGATPVSNARAAAGGATVFAICVTTAEIVEDILFGPSGVATILEKGAIVLDHTTVNPDHVERMNKRCQDAGLRYCEAPMTRTPIHADQGCVNVLFGGEAELLEELRPIFECYAENIFHVGPSGHAIRLKLIHNFIAFANVAAFCEGFALAASEGLDMTKVIGIISAAGGKSGMMDLYGEKTLRRDFTPHMSLANAQKDVKYYARWLEQAGLPGFMAESVHQTYALASTLGHADEGCTAIIKAYEHLSGVEARLPDADEASGDRS